jgi:hypothetical protein
MGFVAAFAAMAESTLLCNKNTPTLTPTVAECEPTTRVHFLSVVKGTEEAYVDGKGKLLAGSNTVECTVLAVGDVLVPTLANPVKL